MTELKRKNELLKYMGLSWNRCGNSLQVMLFEPTFKVESLNPAAREYRAHFEMDKAWEKVEQLWADYERLREALELVWPALRRCGYSDESVEVVAIEKALNPPPAAPCATTSSERLNK